MLQLLNFLNVFAEAFLSNYYQSHDILDDEKLTEVLSKYDEYKHGWKWPEASQVELNLMKYVIVFIVLLTFPRTEL